MVELSIERVGEILQKETPKTEALPLILRSIYTRYAYLYERYFADIDALNDDMIAELKKYHKETKSLTKYYYMDIPYDICVQLNTFDEKYTSKLLGSGWHKYVADGFQHFCDDDENENKSKARLKAEFEEQILTAFYESMDYVFRTAFGTGSKTYEHALSGLFGMLFGGKE